MNSIISSLLIGTAAVEASMVSGGLDVPAITFGHCDGYHAEFLEVGGRGIDTAFSYSDPSQKEVGEAVRNSGIDRSEIFVITKIECCPETEFWGNGLEGCNRDARNVTADLQHNMDMLGLEYVDLMLMHWACDRMDDTVSAYKEMEDFMRTGKARALGVSNFNWQMLEEFIPQISIKPTINQVGFAVGNHAASPKDSPDKQHWGSDEQTYDTCKKLGVGLQAYSPLGGHDQYDVMSDPVVKAVANEVNRSSAQVAMRWLIQRGIPVVTCSSHRKYMEQDLQVEEFELSEDQMRRLWAVNSDAPVPPMII